MSAANPPAKDGPAPFSAESDAGSANPPSDLILRSCNHVDFHVHKQILGFASVFFCDMFAFPAGKAAPTEIVRDGKPVLLLPESDEVLYRLLRLAYPGRSRQQYSFTVADLDSALAVHEAAQKYQFIDAQQLITEMLLDDTLVHPHPHRLFAIGLLRNLPALTQKAALYTLRHPLCPSDLDFPELHLITGANLQKLYAFHRKCGADAAHILRDVVIPRHADDPHRPESLAYAENGDSFVWWLRERYAHGPKCGPTVDILDTIRPANWFRTHIDRLGPQVSAIPAGDTVLTRIIAMEEEVASEVKACNACGENMDGDLAEVAALLGRRIDNSHEKTVRNWAF